MVLDDDLEYVRAAISRVAPGELSREEIESAAAAPVPLALAEEGEEPAGPEKQESLQNLIKAMSIPQRIKLAMFGNQTARTVLLRDTNRIVPPFVLENPRITENEVVEISRNTQIDDVILRAVGNNPQWMKSYQVKLNIVSNPRTPIDLSLKWLKFLRDRELRLLARSKNIPQVIAGQARKLLEKKSE